MRKLRKQRVFSEDLLNEIKQKLAVNELIRYKLPEGGRIHIDRNLPFLIVHRRSVDSQDVGTRNLLLGEAAYLQTSASPEYQPDIKELVSMIAETQARHYGAFLLIELWSREFQQGQIASLPRPGFNIIAPEHSVPLQTLETLEHALQDITLRGRLAKVKISHNDQPAPSGLSPLIVPEDESEHPIICFGLEVDAVYRDPLSSTLLTFALKKLHHGITVAFKKTFYTFSHEHTNFKPEHFHVLGRKAITKAVRKVDKQLARVSDNFDLLLHVTPTNSQAAWEEFEDSHFKIIPEFHYRPRTADPAILKRLLFEAPIEKIEDPALANIFSSKRDELDKQISLLAARGLPEFLPGSIQLYGKVEKSLLKLSETILSHAIDETIQDDKTMLNAEELAEYARAEVKYYQDKDPDLTCSVEVRDDIAGILVSHGNFLIGTDVLMRKNRLNATLSHEIGTHVVTHYNGRQQPFQQLYAGMAGYEELQEGLAVLSEYLVGELDISRMRLLAGRVIAANSVINGDDFIETFNLLLQQYSFIPYTAFLISLRVHRGGGYIKDMVYLRGFSHLLDYLKTGDDFDILYTGKVSLKYLPLIKELRWRQVIKPVALKPRYLEQQDCQNRLKELIEEPTIESILRGL